MKYSLFLFLWVILLSQFFASARKTTQSPESKQNRDGKLFSVFQVVRFPNDVCSGTNKNGTCYTANECSSKGGTNAGTCASGFGVCCTFTIGCGTTSRENCTYIDSSAPAAGNCRHVICPCNENICQLRLDFNTFVIAGPSTASDSEVSLLFGAPSPTAANGQAHSLMSQCLTDTFSVTNSAGANPPVICGTNTDQHMYVDVDRSPGATGCNELSFQLGAMAVNTELPNRQWSIKVSQILCDSPAKAPSGCTQYFLEGSGIVESFNYAGGQHLANQKQSICVRRKLGQCRICWSAVTPEDFAVSGTQNTAAAGMGMGFTKGEICCGYPADGKDVKGYDCLQIPAAMTFGPDKALTPNSRFCGRSVGLIKSGSKDNANDATADITICSIQTPFVIRFISDGFESHNKEVAKPNKGFRLAYEQDSTNCS